MVRARQQVDADDGRTPSMSGFAQADSLRPSELAQASVMGALCAAIAIIAVVLPHAGGLGWLGAVPMGLLAYRYRIRVLITATVAAGVIGFLVVGLSGFGAVALCAYVGGLAGIVKRHHRGVSTVIAASAGAAGERTSRAGTGAFGLATSRTRLGRELPADVVRRRARSDGLPLVAAAVRDAHRERCQRAARAACRLRTRALHG